jgi:hypothetical protein
VSAVSAVIFFFIIEGPAAKVSPPVRRGAVDFGYKD